jgi:hypothetical protein
VKVPNTRLTAKQQHQLTAIAKQHPTCTVRGWHKKYSGPLVRFPGGSVCVIARDGGVVSVRRSTEVPMPILDYFLILQPDMCDLDGGGNVGGW